MIPYNKEGKKILCKEVSGNTGQYGNVSLELDASKYIILQMIVTSISDKNYGSPITMRVGGDIHYAHIVGDRNLDIISNANVSITVYYVEI